MKKKAAEALYEYNNQYPPYAGVPELRQAVARHAERQTGMYESKVPLQLKVKCARLPYFGSLQQAQYGS